MRKLREILRLKYEARRPHREIAGACDVGLGTVSEYVQRACAAGLGWPLPEELDDAALETKLFPAAASSTPRPLPDLSKIHEELKRDGVTLLLLWQEYREIHGEDGYSYSQFCEQYRRWRKKLKRSMRQRHRAGEKTFIDFSGKKPHLVDPDTGEENPVELFVGVLGASSYTYAVATQRQDLPDWVQAHVGMAEFFSGSSEIWVPDNLKSGITKPCRYEPDVNRTYQELAAHYQAVVIPARVRKPKDKAKVETGVLVAQRWILATLRNRTFFSLVELNAAIREKLEVLNNRPMKQLGASRRELFERLDRPALKPLPDRSYELAEWKLCRVNIDYHVEIKHNFYSVPYQLQGEQCEVRFTAQTVEVYFKNNRVASHQRLRGRGQHSTQAKHMPRSHREHAKWTPSRLIRWAEQAGPATGHLVAEIMRRRPHPEQGFRACLGVMRLGRRHGPQRLEAACARCIALSSYSYQTVKNTLSSGMDRLPFEEESSSLTPHHENIRGADYYAAQEVEC
jgi:transposase